MNISLNEYRNKLFSFINEAKKSNWISCEDADNLQSQIDSDQLMIGIVGQMNVGKSTLLNALVFGKDTLPTSETPMTAALTYISYGETPMANVEMLSLSDYNEIRDKSKEEITEESKTEIESAINIVKKIEAIPSFTELMGKTIDISLDDFNEYVGVEGKYTPLVKFMKLTLDNPSLKGICLVDTPGYNDPVSSRNITTKKFLSQANVIIMVQDVLQYFSTPDVELIKDQIPNSGIGKIIIALNKKDMISKDELEKVMISAIEHKSQIGQTDPDVAQMLNVCEVIPVSGIMALLGQLSTEEISHDEIFSFWNAEIENAFPNNTQQDFLTQSGLLTLQEKISDIIIKQKQDILLKAPCEKLQALLQAFINRNDVEKESLEETNGFLADQQIDLEVVLQDLNNFELSVTEYMDTTVSNSETMTLRKIDNTRFALRDIRDREVKNINFTEKNSKKYLRYCFNTIEDVYFKMNTVFSDTLRKLGNDVVNCLHEEISDLERKMNLIVLPNAKQIHTSVMKRINRTINNSIPRALVEELSYEVSFPDFWERQDLYQIGIRTYFRKMLQESFSNEYINAKMSVYEDASCKLLDLIENHISNIISETKKQFNANDTVDIETKIRKNEERILEIKKINEQVDVLKNNVVILMESI